MKFAAPVFTKSGFYLSVDSHDYYFGQWWQITSVFYVKFYPFESQKNHVFSVQFC